MTDSKSIYTSLLQVMIPSKYALVFIRDLSDLTLQIIFEAWWASMNVGSKHPIAWNNSRYAPLWLFYLPCGVAETGCPGIICIICRQVLHCPSTHGTSSVGNHIFPKAHSAKLDQLPGSQVTELTSSMVEVTTFAILMRQGRRGITIVTLSRKFIFDS